MTFDDLGTNFLVYDAIKLKKKLGQGAFGQIWLGEHMQTKVAYAVKLENASIHRPQLLFEYRVYKYLTQGLTDNRCGIPNVHLYTTEGNFNILVMDLLGSSLEDLFTSCGRRFSLKTVLMVGFQILERIHWIHELTFLHRDVKPDNFLIGRGYYSSLIYVIDFGLAKQYIKYNEHIPSCEGKSLTGTGRYASINTHLGFEQGRRDDLESMMYVLLYFLRGQLPWQGLQALSKLQKYQKIKDKKIQTTIESLCEGFPKEFALCLQYIRGLQFAQRPDYVLIHKLFQSMMKKDGYSCDYDYD